MGAGADNDDESLAGRSDAQLLAAWGHGCRASGAALIERNMATVHRFFSTKVSASDLEDLVQQTFMAGLEAHARYRGEVSFRSFLLGIARYRLWEHVRRIARARAVDVDSVSLQDMGTTPSVRLDRSRDQRELSRSLERLPLAQQTILELSYWEGLDGPELAETLGVPLNTAYARLRRAKLALREAWAQQTGEDPAECFVHMELAAHALRNACAAKPP